MGHMQDGIVDIRRLRRLLAEEDMTMVMLAERSGLSYSLIKKVFVGKRGLSDRTALRVATALHRPVSDITAPRTQVAA